MNNIDNQLSKIPKFSKIFNIYELSEKFDLLIFDVWGVLIEASQPYPGIVDIFNDLKKTKKINILSNTPSLPDFTMRHLNKFGFDISEDEIVTSGSISKIFAENSIDYLGINDIKIFSISNNYSNIFENLQSRIVEKISDANIIFYNLYADNEEDKNQFQLLVEKYFLEYKIPLLCLNPDIIIPNGPGKYRYCPGYFANIYSKLGGEVIYTGKPSRKIFEICLSKNPKISKDRILMIGDTLEMDILGANNIGIKSALVTTGNAAKYMNNLNQLAELCSNMNIYPDYLLSFFKNND